MQAVDSAGRVIETVLALKEPEPRMTDFDKTSDRSALRENLTDEEWARAKAAEPGGGGGPNSKYFSGAKKEFHLLGTDLFGEAIRQDTTGKLREKFDFPPFSVLNAREGPWQERKRAWLACGIQSEVGRGENLLKMSDTLLEPDPEKRAAMQAARTGDARTFGSGDPGDLAAGFKRKETASLAGLTVGVTADAYRKAGEEVEGAGGSGTSIFDPVLAELCYRWFCPAGGQIVDPFAGGSVRGIVAGLLGFSYHGIDLRPEQIAANEAQRATICPDADINWVVGDSNVELPNAPPADFIFSCPPYGDLEQYSDDPNDLSAMTWEAFVGMYRSIIRKSVERLKPNRFACFVIGEYRDRKTGLYRGFVPLTCTAFMAAGADLYNEAILITSVGSLPIRITKQFESSRKLGKALRNGTTVLTPTGWVPIEALKVGDSVIAVDGAPAPITGVFPQGIRSLWRITFNDKTSIVADGDHQWGIESNTEYQVLTTADILKRYGARPKVRPQLPSCEPVILPAQPILLDPYLVGLLLGDGGLSTNTPVLTTADEEIANALPGILPAGVKARRLDTSYSYILAGLGSRSLENPLTAILRQLGMMGKKAHQKFVPDIYLWNDHAVRLGVLQGLLDTDGGISGRKGTTEFSSASKQLAEDVAFLARSFGAKVSISERDSITYAYKGERKRGLRSYRVRISGGVCPFRLHRKAAVWTAANEGRTKSFRRSIVSIERETDALATCISIDHPSKLFVAEHFIVTHNTHQNIICVVKGDPKLAVEAIRAAQGAPPAARGPRPTRPATPPPAPNLAEKQAVTAPESAGPSALAFVAAQPARVEVPRVEVPRVDVPRVEVVTPAPAGTLASFLGSQPVRATDNWRPETPRPLDGIDSIVLNVETNGLNWAGGDRPIGVTWGTLDGQIRQFLPFGFRDGNLDETTVLEWARRELRGKHITNANTRFDIHMSREWGVDLEGQGNTVSDVMHYAALLDDHRKRFAVDVLAQDYLGGVSIPRVDERNMASYGAGEVAARAEYQAEVVAALRNKMWPLLDEQELQGVRQLEDEVIYPVVEMEKNGARIDLELLEQYHAECGAEHGRLMQEIAAEVGFAFEHTASGWRRLFERCGLTPRDSYAEDVIEEYDHPLVVKAHYAGQVGSLNSKTFAAYKSQIGPDGILRYDINQLRGDDGGTVSGRFSIGYVQQVPNHDNHSAVFGDRWFPRRLFIPASGLYLDADAAQIEYRIFAHFASNPKVLAAYAADPTMSFHKFTWEMIKVYRPDMKYTWQKSMNFMKMYGGGLSKLALMMGFITKAQYAEIQADPNNARRWNDPLLQPATEIQRAYEQMMPEVAPLQARASHLAKSACDKDCSRGGKHASFIRQLHRDYPHRGYVKTIKGRRSRFPNNWKTYRGLNRVIQGSAADVMKQKLVELHRLRKETGFLMRLTVHDAVGGDVPDAAAAERVREILNRQSFPQLQVPILWSLATGANWAECK